MSKRIKFGIVDKIISSNTISVIVISKKINKIYKKSETSYKSFLVHDHLSKGAIGKKVSIKMCSPKSLKKSWILYKVF